MKCTNIKYEYITHVIGTNAIFTMGNNSNMFKKKIKNNTRHVMINTRI